MCQSRSLTRKSQEVSPMPKVSMPMTGVELVTTKMMRT
jgi:hypothetical protein